MFFRELAVWSLGSAVWSGGGGVSNAVAKFLGLGSRWQDKITPPFDWTGLEFRV